MKSTRSEVMNALDSERTHQEKRFPQGNTLGESVALLNKYLGKLNAAYTKSEGGTNATLDIIRKIGGIAVRTMEEHGAPVRL